MLLTLGIGLLSIDNTDLTNPKVLSVLKEIANMPRQSYRARLKLVGQVESWTILANKLLYFGGSDEGV